MTKIKLKTAIPGLLFASLFTTSAFGQEKKGVEAIRLESVKAQIEHLSHDLFEGRAAGTRGAQLAAHYIETELKQLGLKPYLSTGYLQPFPLHFHRKGGSSSRKDTVLTAYNILGMIEGKRKDEFVVVGGHYDHLGIGNATHGDNIFNGADDNASGTVAVIQLAKAFLADGKQPERTIIFALWDAEECGLFGSKFFVEHFPNPSAIKGYMNFDMIGRNKKGENSNHFVFMYTQANTILESWLKKNVKKYKLDLTVQYRPWDNPIGGSDNTYFAKQGIPIVWFHTDCADEMHKSSDESATINFNKATNIIRSSYLVLRKMANETIR